MSPAARALILASVLSSLARCTASTAPLAGQCEFDSDCDEGLVCANHACRTACRVDRDCPADHRCLASERANALACVANRPSAPACARDGDCPVGTGCLAGACLALCRVDYDCQVVNPASRCEAGHCAARCATGTADCDGDASNGCERLDTAARCGACGRACGGGQACVAGACVAPCAAPRAVCGGACVDVTTDATHCGACATACPAASRGAAACVAGACTLRCEAGYYLDGGACAQVAAPTLAGPLSGSRATSRRPVFRWRSPTRGADGAVVQVCRDRMCTMEVARFSATGASASPSTELAPGVYFWRAFGRQGAVDGLTPSSATYEIVIPARDAGRSAAWGTYGDVNGDGFGDALIAEPNATRVQVYHGGASGLPAAPTQTLSVSGKTDFGKCVALAGDVDADGFVDAVVGAPTERAVYLFHGGATGLSAAGERLAGPTFDWGTRVTGAGDVNGDGYADLLVWDGLEASGVYVVAGGPRSATPSITRLENVRAVGASPIAGPGPIDGDAYDDAVVAALDAAGPALFVFCGGPMGLSPAPVARIPMQSMAAVAAAGDVNGDGYADVLVGADVGASMAWVYTGSAAGLNAEPAFTFTDSKGGDFGAAVSGAGDVNGDGFGDFVVGDGQGSARVFLGAATREAITDVRVSGSPGLFSAALAQGADYDRDGLFDVLIGSPDFGGGKGPCSGPVYVFRGARGGISTTPWLTLGAPEAMRCGTAFGASIAWNMRWPTALYLG
jgi:hypothetical protein